MKRCLRVVVLMTLFFVLLSCNIMGSTVKETEQLRISVVANQTRNMTIKDADRITENDEIIIYGSFKLEVQQGKADWQLASDLPEADRIKSVTLYEQVGDTAVPIAVYQMQLGITEVGWTKNVWGGAVLVRVGEWNKEHKYYFEGITQGGMTVKTKTVEITVAEPAEYSAIIGDMDLFGSAQDKDSHYSNSDVVRYYTPDGKRVSNLIFDQSATVPSVIVGGKRVGIKVYEVTDLNNEDTVKEIIEKHTGKDYIMMIKGYSDIGEDYTECPLPNNSGGGGISIQRNENQDAKLLTGVNELYLTTRAMYIGSSTSPSYNKKVKFLVGTWAGQYKGIPGHNYVVEVKEISDMLTKLAAEDKITQGYAKGELSIFRGNETKFDTNTGNKSLSFFTTDTNGFLQYGSTAHVLISEKGGLTKCTDRNQKPVRMKVALAEDLDNLVKAENIYTSDGKKIETFDELQIYAFQGEKYAVAAAKVAENSKWAQGFILDYVGINKEEELRQALTPAVDVNLRIYGNLPSGKEKEYDKYKAQFNIDTADIERILSTNTSEYPSALLVPKGSKVQVDVSSFGLQELVYYYQIVKENKPDLDKLNGEWRKLGEGKAAEVDEESESDIYTSYVIENISKDIELKDEGGIYYIVVKVVGKDSQDDMTENKLSYGPIKIKDSKLPTVNDENKNMIVPTSISNIYWKTNFVDEYKDISYSLDLTSLVNEKVGSNPTDNLFDFNISKLGIAISPRMTDYEVTKEGNTIRIDMNKTDLNALVSGEQAITVYIPTAMGTNVVYSDYKKNYVGKIKTVDIKVYGKKKYYEQEVKEDGTIVQKVEYMKNSDGTSPEILSGTINVVFKEMPQIN